MGTRLENLMKKTGMTERELADTLSVDKSLVNKWKNGKRKLAPSSPYFTTISTELAKKSQLMMPNILDVYLGGNHARPLEERVAGYLAYIENAENEGIVCVDYENGENITARLFSGCANRLAACKAFFNEALKLRDKHIYMLSPLDEHCMSGENDYEQALADFVTYALAGGNTVHLLYICHDVKAYAPHFIKYSHIALSDKLKISIKVTPASKNEVNVISFTAGDNLSLVGSGLSDYPALSHFILSHDRDISAFEIQRWKAENAASVPFWQLGTAANAPEILRIIVDMSPATNPTFIYAEMPTLIAMSDELLHKIFAFNSLTPDSAETAVLIYNGIKKIYLQNLDLMAIKEAYTQSALNAALNEDGFYLSYLSAIARKPIIVPKSLYTEYFQEYINFINTAENVRIALLSQSFPDVESDFAFIVKEYSYAVASSTTRTDKNLLFTRDVLPVETVYSAFETHFEKIPPFLENRAVLLEQFERVLRLIEN